MRLGLGYSTMQTIFQKFENDFDRAIKKIQTDSKSDSDKE